MSPGVTPAMGASAALGLLLAVLPAPAAGCPEPPPALLVHSCRGAEAALLLLPEDTVAATRPGDTLLVTGAYTATDTRAEGRPKPVGLFLRRGLLVNRNLGRMDGILVIEPDGRLALHHRARVQLDGRTHDLTTLPGRRAFIDAARAAGASVAQSHLLVVDGQVDVRPRADAPLATRRLLFTDESGWGIWESPGPMTLHEAAEAIAAAHAPRMALNLDMGSFNYCWWLGRDTASRCGLLGRDDTGALSNLIAIGTVPAPESSPGG